MADTKKVRDILELMKLTSKKDKKLVKDAYNIALKVYDKRMRFSGETYFNHVYATARKLAELGMNSHTVAAGFLHDTIEDGILSDKEVLDKFGNDVLFLVKGVTKLGKLKYRGLERHTESLRKLFIATAQDVRVLIIRLADRIHNVKTLDGHPSEKKRVRIATETLEIFVPLADRLGMGQLRGELEDAAFPYAYPKEYKKVTELLKQRKILNKKYLEKVHRALQKRLAIEGIKNINIDYRVKRIYSLYKKLLRNDMDLDKIYDVVALRVIVPSVEDCYRVLGIIHSLWKPLPGKIKDYIALPKENGYQSIHTTIFTGDGGIAEIQIRTPKMHEEAEFGIASHLVYKRISSSKNTKEQERKVKKDLPWIKQILEWQKSVSDSGEFLENLKTDFFKDRVFAFTPKGDVIDLPEDSTIVDFAYAIHTDIGSHTSGAKIGGKMASLNTKLKNGDIVEIVTNKKSKPTSKWLKFVKTTIARRHIRAFIETERIKLKNFLPNIGRHHLF